MGRAALIERCRRHPLYRALRPDRMALAALEGVLRLHLAEAPAAARPPLARCRRPTAPAWRGWPQPRRRDRAAEIVPAEAFLGGGSAPEAPIPGEALRRGPAATPSSPACARAIPPVVGYLRQGRLLLDLRTVAAEDDDLLIAAVRRRSRLRTNPNPKSKMAKGRILIVEDRDSLRRMLELALRPGGVRGGGGGGRRRRPRACWRSAPSTSS